MRLVNTTSGLFEEFLGTNIPEYAILSHTWEDGEVSFKDMNDGTYKNKKGFRKIEKTCQMAAMGGLQYAWIDTCCIDKSSSAELTEAINSMYRWYQRSNICYGFLSDLSEEVYSDVALSKCRWFTRGWTLQELLAPLKVYFFNQKWEYIGSKATLAPILSEITGVDVEILQTVRSSLASIPVATKMSWAANRETTRVEDRAYSLLGIFDVHMPLIYGEEEQAFRRLQEEIIKTTPDLSIFGWTFPSNGDRPLGASTRVLCGLLADSPTAFIRGRVFGLRLTQNLVEFSLSNTGLKTRLGLKLRSIPGKRAFGYVLPLNYDNALGRSLGVRLRKVGPDQFLRENPWSLEYCNDILFPEAPRERYLCTQLPRSVNSPSPFISTDVLMPQMRTHALQVRLPRHIRLSDAWSSVRYDSEDQLFFVSGNSLCDWGILKLIGHVDVTIASIITSFRFSFFFYGIGWSSTRAEELQCSLIDLQAFTNEMIEARNQIVDWDHNQFRVLRTLAANRIPKTSVVAIDVPRTDKYVLISYALQSVVQPGICGNPFWAVEFSSEVIERKNQPVIERGSWVVK